MVRRRVLTEGLVSGQSWEALGRLLDDVRPKGLGLLLPPLLQLHGLAYVEARARGIVVASTFPSQLGALTGLAREISIEAFVTTEALAREVVPHLEGLGILSSIKGWLIVTTSGEVSPYTPPKGVVVFDPLL
ncbi:MAG: hypothetical protein WCK46_00295 [Candidatus Adlerbacteria bacterium]